MDREIFIKKLETYQTSMAPINVKVKAINRLKDEFFKQSRMNINKQILDDISASSSELKYSELY